MKTNAKSSRKACEMMLATSKKTRFDTKNVKAAAKGITKTKAASMFAMKFAFLDSRISSAVYLFSGDIPLK